MKHNNIKKLKGFGFLIISLFFSLVIIYLTFPVWVGVVINSQLPKDVSVHSYEIDLPSWDSTYIESINIKAGEQFITFKGVEFDYQLNEIRVAQVVIENVSNTSSINRAQDSHGNNLIVKLPLIIHSDFEVLEQLKQVSIKAITLKTQSQIINFTTVLLKRTTEGIYQISSDEVSVFDNSNLTKVSNLTSNLEVTTEQIKFHLFQINQNSEQSLVSLNYLLTEQQIQLSALVNYSSIQTLIMPAVGDAVPVFLDDVKIEWLQNRLDNKLELSLSSILKSSELSIDDNTVFPTTLTISTESEYYPLLAKVEMSLNSNSELNLDSELMAANIQPFTFDSYFNVSLGDLSDSDAKLLISDINYSLKLQAANIQSNDAENKQALVIVNADQVSLIGAVSDISTSIEEFDMGHWNLTGNILLPSLSLDYGSAANESNVNEPLELKTAAEVNFQIDKKETLKFAGNFVTNDMQINHADGQLNPLLKVEWSDIDTSLSTGTASVVARSVNGTIVGLDYAKAELLSEINFIDKEVNGDGTLSVNEQLLTPYSFEYNKQLSDFSITLQKNQLGNQLLNYFLRPFSKDAKTPLQITNGEVVHSASLELSDEMIIESIFNINDMSFNFGENNIYGLNLTQRITSFSPIKLHSSLSIDSVNFSSGLEITNINTTIDSGVSNVFETTTFNGELFNGKLYSKAIKFNADGINQSIIELKKISLTELIFFLEVSGLYADGNIDFSLPISLKNGVLVIKDGSFKALDKGIIKYTYTDTDTGEEENIALKALKNFHYESLDGTFSYNKDGLYHMKLHLLGANPDLYDGYPVDFILNLRGELSGVFRSLFLTGNFEDAIMEQIKASEPEQ